MQFDRKYKEWWALTWNEREQLLRSTFGETVPPRSVISFEWQDIETMVPGGCALVFPPQDLNRSFWLTMTHGLTQPVEPSEPSQEVTSGYGYEFAFLTRSNESWTVPALGQLLTYLKQSNKSIDRGHRVPMWFRDSVDGIPEAELGRATDNDSHVSLGEMRALVFWPYMAFASGFSTSTGYFSILVGTTVSSFEWEMAKTTSTTHLLVMLFANGIGQVSDLLRPSLESLSTFDHQWNKVRTMQQDEVEGVLLEYAGWK